MKTIKITLPDINYHYQVKIGSGILKDCLADALSNYEQKDIYLITNQTVHQLNPDFISKFLPAELNTELLILPDGEQHKNLENLSRIYDFLADRNANRKSILLGVGGGVIGDIVGFAAATFMRGISHIQIPTTLLSQVDSSVGGKTGINHRAGKNLIGAFKQPYQTIIEVDFLQTLPEKEIRSGYAELIKHGFIRDAYLFQILKKQTLETLKADKQLLIEAIFRSCEVKARIVEIDEKESGQRAILNFGHTLGHFLETFTDYTEFLHGDAIIIGMDFAAWWSWQQQLLDQNDYLLIHDHLKSLGIEHQIPKIEREEFQRIIEHDKKFSDNGIRFIGLTEIGNARIFDKITSESLWNNLQMFLKIDSSLQIEQ